MREVTAIIADGPRKGERYEVPDYQHELHLSGSDDFTGRNMLIYRWNGETNDGARVYVKWPRVQTKAP